MDDLTDDNHVDYDISSVKDLFDKYQCIFCSIICDNQSKMLQHVLENMWTDSHSFDFSQTTVSTRVSF